MAEPVDPVPAIENPKVVEQQIKEVEKGDHEFNIEQTHAQIRGHRFKPDKGLPVWINYTNPRDPFELYEEVTYENGPIKVVIPAGFRCDATSTPAAVFLTPALFQILAAVGWYAVWPVWVMALFWAIGTALAILLPWVMPGVGQLGLHARAAVVHDALYRTQVVARVVADAVMWEIMEYDRVRLLPKWMVYILLRALGFRAWRANAVQIAANAVRGLPTATAGPIDEPTATAVVEPVVVPDKKEPTP